MELGWLLLGWAVIVIASMAVVVYLASRWGRDAFGWVILAAAMGPIAIVALYGTHQSDVEHRASYAAAERTHEHRRVLVACDGSPATARVAHHIATVYRGTGANVSVLAVVPHEIRPQGAVGAEEHDRRVATMTAPAMKELHDAGLDVSTTVGYGSPGEEIVRCGNEQDADVIAVGRRGAGLSKAVLGSVSDYVVRNAKRPVIIID